MEPRTVGKGFATPDQRDLLTNNFNDLWIINGNGVIGINKIAQTYATVLIMNADTNEVVEIRLTDDHLFALYVLIGNVIDESARLAVIKRLQKQDETHR